jgi:voltage-gated potassium channel
MYIILSARQLAPSLFIIARAGSEESEPKLMRAGANRTIDPYSSGGQRMAWIALNPLISDFIETTLRGHGRELLLEDISILPTSLVTGKSIKEAQNQSRGASILAIKKQGGRLLAKPRDDVLIEPGDRLIILGSREQLRVLQDTS